ncbi:hypothetical protein, partial [Escherichia coli]|uniref:hypothetical protein n=1 Tax=Escherichia coli TaxID=562 RepID=UPI001ABBA22F
CVEQDDKGWDARKRAYCLKIQPATGSFARNLIYSTKPFGTARQQHERACNCEFFHHSSCMRRKEDCGIKALMSPAFPGSERNLI